MEFLSEAKTEDSGGNMRRARLISEICRKSGAETDRKTVLEVRTLAGFCASKTGLSAEHQGKSGC